MWYSILYMDMNGNGIILSNMKLAAHRAGVLAVFVTVCLTNEER